MLDINLIEDLPYYFRAIRDYQVLIQTEQLEFDEMSRDISQMSDDMYTSTMGLEAVKRCENLFQVIANPVSETLQFRRERLLNRWATRTPFTLTYLCARLNALLGKNNWKVQIDYAHYLLRIDISADVKGFLGEIIFMVEFIKPAHLDFTYTIITEDTADSTSFCTAAVSTQYRYSDIIPALPIASEQTADSIEQGAIQALFTKQYEIGVA